MRKLETDRANDQAEIGNENRHLRLMSLLNVTKCIKQQSPYISTCGGVNKNSTNMIYSCLNIVKMT